MLTLQSNKVGVKCVIVKQFFKLKISTKIRLVNKGILREFDLTNFGVSMLCKT